MDDNAVNTQASKQSMMERMRDHHRRKPILMVLLVAVFLVAISAGSVYAFIVLTTDRATFRSNINSSSPVRQHILRVDGAGELVATLRDRTDNDTDRVRFNLAILDEQGELLQRTASSNKGQTITVRQQVDPGDYTFIIKSDDTLTEVGASYQLNIAYPNDVVAFSDKTSPTLEITQPQLGATVTGEFTISGTAADNIELAQVAVRVDGDGTWVIAEGSETWELILNSRNYSNGQRVINVQATDTSGNTEVEQTLVNFDNGLITPDPEPEPEPEPDPEPELEPDTGSNPGPSDPPTSGGTFTETFTDNTGLNNFRVGVYHRNIGQQVLGQATEVWGDGNAMHGGSWTGDHDLSCGSPDTQRQLSTSKTGGPSDGDRWTPDPLFNLDKIVYVCRDHVMTSMGDVDGYSILWFSPNQDFNRSEAKTISWDVNVTDLRGRQWWEVSIVPKSDKFLATVNWLADTANIDTYNNSAVVVGSGPFGGTINITTNGDNRYNGWQGICGAYGLDLEGCKSKAIRRRFTITDNMNGTLTVNYGGMFTQTVSGQLPDNFEVYFKDHNYTPDKGGEPVGHTWHWDNISIK